MPKLAQDYVVQWTDKKRQEVLGTIEDYLCEFGTKERIMQIGLAREEGIKLLADIAYIVQPEYIGEDR